MKNINLKKKKIHKFFIVYSLNKYRLLRFFKIKPLYSLNTESTLVNYSNKFIMFFIKHGYLVKNTISLLNTYLFIYKYFLNLKNISSLNNKTYLYLIEFFFNITINKRFLNINQFLFWLVGWNNIMFNIKMEKVAKKFKKKYKVKYLYKVNYVSKTKQACTTLRWFYLNIFNFNTKSVKTQLLHSLLDTILNYKKSTLYKKKINVYYKLIYNK